MPVFEYKGFDASGRAVSGIVDADGPKVARQRLRKQGVFPTDVREQIAKGARGRGLNVEIDLSQYLQFVSPRDVAIVTKQMATLLSAAVPVVEALSALVDQTEKAKLKVVLSQVKDKVNEGSSLADALGDHPRVFPDIYVQMVRAGERSGALDEVLERLADYQEKQVELQGKVIGALVYPILMSVVGAGILTFLYVGVVPRIRRMFDTLGGQDQLPLITRVVFGVGDFLQAWWFVLPPLMIGAIWGFRRWVRTPKGREKWDAFKLRLPVIGRVNRLIAVSRFCRTLATLLISGVPILTALEIGGRVVGNSVLAKAVDNAARNIQEGQSIAVPLRQSGQFPPVVTHMIAIGEKTGELERMLGTVSKAYESEVSATLEGLTSLLSPVVILVMGGAVFVVALSLLLPMMRLTSMMNH